MLQYCNLDLYADTSAGGVPGLVAETAEGEQAPAQQRYSQLTVLMWVKEILLDYENMTLNISNMLAIN